MKNKIMNGFKQNKLLLVVVLITLITSVFFGFQKNGLFLDEIYSYGLSNSNRAPFIQDIKGGSFIDSVLTREELNDYVTVSQGEAFDYGSVYYNQSQDVHPPLFYMFLHTVCSIFPGNASKWLGLGLNIFIYIATVICLYKACMILFKNKKVSLAVALMYGISHGGLSTVMMIRMYMLLTFFTVLLAYFILKFLDQKKWHNCIFIGVTIFLGLFTQYYFVFYAFFVCAAVVIYLLAKKDIKNAAIFGISAVLGVLLMYLCYPVCVDHLFADKTVSGGSALSNLTNPSIYSWRIKIFAGGAFGSVDSGILIGLLALVMLIIKYKSKPSAEDKEIRTKSLIIFIPAIIALLISAIISPYVIIRYVYNIIPLLLILPAYAIYRSLRVYKNSDKYMKAVVILVLVISYTTLVYSAPTWLYRNYDQYDRIMEEQQGKICLYITQNADHAVGSDLHQLTNFEELFITDDIDSPKLDEYVCDKNMGQGIVIYIENGKDLNGYTVDEFLEYAAEKYGYEGYEYLFGEKDFSKAYLLK